MTVPDPAPRSRVGGGRWHPGPIPRTLSGRLWLLLVIGLVTIAIVSVGVGWNDRWLARREAVAGDIADRAVEIARLLEATPDANLALALAAVEGPYLRVSILPAQAAPAPPKTGADDPLAAAVGAALRARLGRDVAVAIVEPARRGEGHDRRHGAFMGVERLAMRIPLADGRQMRLVAPLPGPLRSGPSFALWIGVAAALALVLSVFAAHRMTRPFARFTAALDRFGGDLAAPPLPEHGAAEVRRAAAAFNRMQDRLRRFVADRTRMLAAISHDLRTPLTRLRLRIEAIPDPADRDKARADIAAMQQMIDASLAFARDALAEEAAVALDLAALLQTLADEASDQGQDVRYDGPDRCPMTGRPVALRRAFANLIDNAVRHGGAATITLARETEALLIMVDDPGPGIPPAMRERVFEPFVRLDDARGAETGGTGLGLAIVQSAIRAHDGEVAIGDAPGGGCRVRVRLPYRPV